MKKTKIVPGPHYAYAVIGTDGSFIGSELYWWRYIAEKERPDGCRVECFRLMRTDPKNVKGRNARRMGRKT